MEYHKLLFINMSIALTFAKKKSFAMTLAKSFFAVTPFFKTFFEMARASAARRAADTSSHKALRMKGFAKDFAKG